MSVHVPEFFAFAKERYQIFLQRDRGDTPPWTDDEVLQQSRFCNVFREDDRVTRWFREHIREPRRNSPTVIFATVAFRFFNTVRTGEVLLSSGLLDAWSAHGAREALGDLHPLVTGAYMVKTPLHQPKLEGLIEILQPVWDRRFDLLRDLQGADTLEAAHARLCEFPWVGPFMAYEFVTDLRHTAVLRAARDINTWANPGPGAERGLKRVFGGSLDARMGRVEMLKGMQFLLAESRQRWPSQWPTWEMREVEHVLCEYDKYMRAVLGEGRPKQKFRGV